MLERFVRERNGAEIARSLEGGVTLEPLSSLPFPCNPNLRAVITLFAPDYQVEGKKELQESALRFLSGVVSDKDLFTQWSSAMEFEVDSVLLFLGVQSETKDETKEVRLVAKVEWLLRFIRGLMQLRNSETGEVYRLSIPLYIPRFCWRALQIPDLVGPMLETLQFSDLRILAGSSRIALDTYRGICGRVLDLSFRSDEIGQLAWDLLNTGRDEIPVEVVLARFERADLRPEERRGMSLRLILAGENVVVLPSRLLEIVKREAKSPDLEREMCALHVAAALVPSDTELRAQALRRARQIGSWSLDDLHAHYLRRGLSLETAPAMPQLQLMLVFQSVRLSALDILTVLYDDSAEARAIVFDVLHDPDTTLWSPAYRLAEAIRIDPARLMPNVQQGIAAVGAVIREVPMDGKGLTYFLPAARAYLVALLGEGAGDEYRQLVRTISACWKTTIPE